MKITKFETARLLKTAFLFAVVAFLSVLSSCKTDPVTNKAAPSLTLSSPTASNLAGAVVTTTVTINAPEGGKTLTILVNGVANATLPNVDLAAATSKDVPVSFTIPANSAVGSTYVITFQASDSKDQLSTVAIFAVTVSAVPAKTIVEVTADIVADATWTKDKIYRLNGFIRVGEDKKATAAAGVLPTINKTATLTIEAGTVILGKKGTPGGALIIQRGSKLIANGTATAPIVFTSDQAPGNRTPGDWAGVVLCGQADNNIKASTSTGVDKVEELEGGYGAYHGGGANFKNDDNSGSLKYVRIEYAGYPINPNQEINGLTFGSVGSGTTIDYVQVTYANDDSYEWFGGSVNCKHLIALKGIDDDFDTDNGFSGQVQFGLGIRAASIADQSGSNGFECDNDAQGSANTPFTSAVFSNMTIIGGKATSGTTIDIQFQNGAQIRRNAKQKHYNSIITAYPNGLYIDNALGAIGAVANAAAGDIVFKNCILAGVEKWGGNGFGSASTADERTAMAASTLNTTYPFLIPTDANHPNPPRGRVVAAGVGGFGAQPVTGSPSAGAFVYTGTAGVSNELQISGLAGSPWFVAASSDVVKGSGANTLLSKWTDSGLSANIFDPLSAPTLLPTAGSPLLTGASFTGVVGAIDTTPTYRGAFGATDWTSGWSNWNPLLTDYSK